MKKTALFDKHIELNAKMVDFGGFNMPIQYSGISNEHINVRTNVGIFDVSHMGEFFVSGKEALQFLNHVCSNNIQEIEINKAQYNCFTNENGGIIDDLIVYRCDENEYMLVVNASNIDKDWNWLNSYITKYDCSIINESDNIGLISVQGPKSLQLLNDVFNKDFTSINKFNFKTIEYRKHKVIISNTGYTGSPGYEIYLNNNIILEIWDLLLNHGKKYDLCPVGLGARDTLRIEMGYCLYGNEINDDITPYEANLMWITDMNKDFIGKKSLEKSINNSKKKLVGFKIIERGIPRKNYHVFDSENNLIGKVTSGTFSPSNKLGVGMALIDFKNFKSNKIFIELRNKRIKGLIQKLPI